ncbi:MAG: glycosyltransferase family 2 protein [Erysipelotrichaceae bacterium]
MELISIVVPCFNEENSITPFYNELLRILLELNLAYEILFIDDGSSDQTLLKIQSLTKADHQVFYYSFSRNFGKEAAMLAGLSESRGNYVVLMDVDLQHPPYLLIEMYRWIKSENIDCVGAMRLNREGENHLRSFMSHHFYSVLNKISHLEMKDGQGDYRMMSRAMVDSLLSMKEYNRYLKGMFNFVGYQTKWIPYDNVERIAGDSKWSMKQLFAYAVEGIFSFSTAPLMLASLLGTIFILIGFLLCIYIMLTKFTTFKVIMMMLFLLSGFQIFFIGIVGEYLAKNYLESKHRPSYIIARKNR